MRIQLTENVELDSSLNALSKRIIWFAKKEGKEDSSSNSAFEIIKEVELGLILMKYTKL